jgi:DNA-binding CsgD family transcriptional regulator
MRFSTVRGGIAPAAAAAVFLTPAENDPNIALLPWATAFGLTPTETRVLALLSQGSTIKDVAKLMGIAPTTARTHLARLMQKVGTTRQAELVRMVAQLAAPLRPPAR